MRKLTAEDWAKKIITECEPCRKEGSWMRKCGGCLQHAYSLARAVLDKSAPAGELGEALELAQKTKRFCEKCESECKEELCSLYKHSITSLALLALAVENGRLRDRIEIDLAPAVDFYQAEIERLKKESGWTAVADKPVERGTYEVCIYHPESKINFRDQGYFDNGIWQITGLERPGYKVYAWRKFLPLPEPPEPGDE